MHVFIYTIYVRVYFSLHTYVVVSSASRARKADYVIPLIHHHVTFNFNPETLTSVVDSVSTLQRFPQQWLVLASVSLGSSMSAAT
jgi:hypothetical protein